MWQPIGDGLVQKVPTKGVEFDGLGHGLQESTKTPGSSLYFFKQKLTKKGTNPDHRSYAKTRERTAKLLLPPEKRKGESGWVETLKVF